MESTTRTPVSLWGFMLATLAIAVAYGSAFLPGGAPAWSPWLLAIGTAASIVSVMALGASRPGRDLGILRLAFAATFVVVVGGLGLALSLPAETATTPLWLGLPRRAAILLYGIGLLPVLFLPVAYAMTFDRVTLSEDDLRRLRERVAELQRDARGDGSRTVEVPPGTGAGRADGVTTVETGA